MDETEKKANINNQPIYILLVEDNEADIIITLRAFEKAKMKNRFMTVRNGEEALDYMYHRNKYADQDTFPYPDLILLDINMPRLDGFGVLKQLKEDSQLKIIPVIMLTSSKNKEEVARSYRYGAASFIQKPVHYEEFMEVVTGFNSYWHTITTLPHLSK